jgi:hypothetical protein
MLVGVDVVDMSVITEDRHMTVGCFLNKDVTNEGSDANLEVSSHTGFSLAHEETHTSLNMPICHEVKVGHGARWVVGLETVEREHAEV